MTSKVLQDYKAATNVWGERKANFMVLIENYKKMVTEKGEELTTKLVKSMEEHADVIAALG